jgi:hypothetical protein
MATIFQFPGRDEREWLKMEAAAIAHMQNAGAPEQMIQDIMPRLKTFYDKMNMKLDLELDSLGFPISEIESALPVIEKVTDIFSKWVHDLTSSLMVERLKREIEIWQIENE